MVVLGPSGAGKSTLARLLVSAIKPTSGTIRLDGFELDQWDDTRRGQALGYVPQDIALFPGTVAENIARLDPSPNSEAVIHAAKLAGVHDLIARFPNGYDTMLGPGYHDISGGQRQRIALARAFYGNPKVLVLDEPNAHLDAQGEELLMRALSAARAQQITTILISQRQSILQVADFVMVIQDGKIANMGPIRRQDSNAPQPEAPQAGAPAASPAQPSISISAPSLTPAQSQAPMPPRIVANAAIAKDAPSAPAAVRKTETSSPAPAPAQATKPAVQSQPTDTAPAPTLTPSQSPPLMPEPQTAEALPAARTDSPEAKSANPATMPASVLSSTPESVKERTIVMRAGRPDDVITAIGKKPEAPRATNARGRPVMLPKGPPGPDTPQEPNT